MAPPRQEFIALARRAPLPLRAPRRGGCYNPPFAPRLKAGRALRRPVAPTDKRILWAGAFALAASASFAMGVSYGMPLVSVESHYDLDRIVHRLFWEMRESDVYLTHNNYGLLMSADWDAHGTVLFPNTDGGRGGGKSWSPEGGAAYHDDYPNGTRLYRLEDPDGNVLREIAFHGERDKVVMVMVIDFKTDYLTASERDRITEEFYSGDAYTAPWWP